MEDDIDYVAVDGRPVLIQSVVPHRNLAKTARSAGTIVRLIKFRGV